MKLTVKQEEFVAQLLRSVLKFKDTYDEVYDHILASFEALPDGTDFRNAIHDIIEFDFGGARGLKAIERKHTRLAIHHFIMDYLKALLKPLTSVTILLIMAITGLFYFLIASGWLDRRYVLLVITFIPISVFGIAVYRFRQQVKFLQAGQQVIINYVRHTIIDFSGIFMLSFPNILWSTTNIICGEVPPSVCAIVFFVVTLHTFAGYKMYTTPVIQG